MFKVFFSKRLKTQNDLNLKYPLFLLNQIHSDNIFILEDIKDINKKIDADAIITNLKGVAIGVKTADCLPILMFDKIKNVAACVHSGWKGTIKRILLKTVRLMKERYGCNYPDIEVFIGPAICGKCYSVREDVFNLFKSEFGNKLKYEKRNESFFLDLKVINKEMLIDVGIKNYNIFISQHCTSCNNDVYQSFRKNKNTIKYQISYICIIL